MDQDETWLAGIGLRPGHTVLDGDPARPTKRGTAAPTFEFYGRSLCVHIICGPCLLWPNGWMDEDVTWRGGRPRPRPRCAIWGPSSPSSGKKAQPFNFWPMSVVANIVLDANRAPPPTGHSPLSFPNFRSMSVVAKRLDGSRCQFVRR